VWGNPPFRRKTKAFFEGTEPGQRPITNLCWNFRDTESLFMSGPPIIRFQAATQTKKLANQPPSRGALAPNHCQGSANMENRGEKKHERPSRTTPKGGSFPQPDGETTGNSKESFPPEPKRTSLSRHWGPPWDCSNPPPNNIKTKSFLPQGGKERFFRRVYLWRKRDFPPEKEGRNSRHKEGKVTCSFPLHGESPFPFP